MKLICTFARGLRNENSTSTKSTANYMLIVCVYVSLLAIPSAIKK